MSYLFYGGSFDPVHVGHLIASRSACETLGLEAVVLIPCASPPHKSPLLPIADRIRIIDAALEKLDSYPPVRFSDIEATLKQPSYTIETVRALKKDYGKVNWMIGGDTVNQLPTWHKIQELVEECNFIITERPGYTIDWDALPHYLSHLKKNVVDVPLLNISATSIRRRINDGKSIQFLLPDRAIQVIKQWKFYHERSGVEHGGKIPLCSKYLPKPDVSHVPDP